ncbi:hypothetical protein T12_14085, partial [Trichinella patagoniensis]
LSDLAHQTLEGELANQKLGALLVLANLPQSHGSGTEAMGLLHATGSRSGLTGRLGGQLLPWGLAAGGFARCLLRPGHC